MLKKLSYVTKMLSVLLVLTLLFNFAAVPTYSVAVEFTEYFNANSPPGNANNTDKAANGENTEGDQTVGEGDPTLGQITIPTVTSNPYNPEVHKLLYPVLRSDHVSYFEDVFHTIQSNGKSKQHSDYYSASIASMISYYYAGGYAGGYLKQDNGASNMRKNTLNPDIYVFGQKLGYSVNAADDYTNFLRGSYVYDYLHLNKEHLTFKLRAEQIGANHVKMEAYANKENGKSSRYHTEMTHNGEVGTIDIPLKGVASINGNIDGYCYGGSSFTNVIGILVDDTSPSVTDITVSQEIKENDDAELIMTMTFNEGIRFADLRDGASAKYLDSMWVDVEIEELETGKLRTVRLYTSDVGTDCTMTLRADIGRYHYYKYRVNRITDVGFDATVDIKDYTMTVIDLMAKVEDGPDAALYSYPEASDFAYRSNFKGKVTPITDIAGNSLLLESIVDWSFGDQFNDPSFGIEKIEIFNDKTLSLAEGNYSPEELLPEDLFIGTNTNVTVKVYLSRILKEEQWKTISIKLNLIGPDGNYIVIKPTRAMEYSKNHLYDIGAVKGSVLLFENVKLPKGTYPDVEEGGDPVIRVTELRHNIIGLDFYPYFDIPVTDMRTDFTSPTVSARLVENRTVGEGKDAYYTAIIELLLSDVVDYSKIAGLVGGDVTVSLGAGVENDVNFKYIFGTDIQSPATLDGYNKNGTLVKNGYAKVGSMDIISDPQKLYLHILINEDNVYVDDLKLDVQLTDAVGNLNDQKEIPIMLEYIVDKVAPQTTIVSKTATATEGNTKIVLDVNVAASDASTVSRMEYYVGNEPDSDEASWTPIVINGSGADVTGIISREYGGIDPTASRIINEQIWVRSYDQYGNASEPVSTYVSLSLEKPATKAELVTDGNKVKTDHVLIVKGPDASALDGTEAYTRVTIAPLYGDAFAYAVLVKTGESVNIFDYEKLSYYKITTETNVNTTVYTDVKGPFKYSSGESVENHPLRDLFTYYGELKISFENGFGNMTPVVGKTTYDSANDGSYYKDPNYITVRFASPYDEGRTVHSIDYGKVISRTDEVLTETLRKDDAPIVIPQSEVGFGAMRNMQIHFSIQNIACKDFGYLDLDYEGSYAEFYLLAENGGEDALMSRVNGLSASGSQYFTVGNTDDNGNLYKTGAYYLKVTLKSLSGHEDVYKSGLIVLDAETADSAGLWEYSYMSPSNINYVNNSNSYKAVVYERNPDTEEYFTDFGISVLAGGETMRSRMFAVYTYGATSLTVRLAAPNITKTVAGVEVGKLSGFKVWNILSVPTDEEIAKAAFSLDYANDYLSVYNRLDDIYDKDTIPKGLDAIGELHLVKGVNTFCYQAKLENGYITPIRYFTITVTDRAPTLNIAIDDYIPSHSPSTVDGVINIDSIRMFVETAYSFNGSGKVDVQLWSTYAMNLGLYGEDGWLDEAYCEYNENGEPLSGILDILKTGLQEGEYAVLTENSYTSDFPNYSTLCTAVFVAVDEYGGTTIIAPQLGNAQRHRVYGGVAGEKEYNISYHGDYYSDPYVVDDNLISWYVVHNEASYNGNILLGFESYLVHNVDGEEIKVKVLSTDNSTLGHNLFNISSNDIEIRTYATEITAEDSGVTVYMGNIANANLITQLSTITISGDGIDGEVTLPLFEPNSEYGYSGASIEYLFDTYQMTFRFANPKADAEHLADTELNRKFKLTLDNGYGETFSSPEYHIFDDGDKRPWFAGDFTLRYLDYQVTDVNMSESGAILSTNFFMEDGTQKIAVGKFNPNLEAGSNGMYSITVKDLYGNDVILSYIIEHSIVEDSVSNVEISKASPTAKPVTVTISAPGVAIFADIVDYDIMSVEGNGTSYVTVTLTENARFSYRYIDSEGYERVYYINVNNIVKPNTQVTFDPNQAEPVIDTETGEKFLYGEVRAYIIDENFMIIDAITGLPPVFAFIPGGPNTYTYPAGTLIARLGNDENAEDILLGEITVSLPYPLREIPEGIGAIEDNEAPAIQVLAFSNQAGEWSEEKLAMQLSSRRGIYPFTSYSDYTVYGFLGERANMEKLLNVMGWSTSYRFLFEISDDSRVRLFLKEGLYADAPAFENGLSDLIEGVELNSKLLTVNKAAKFTVFAVDSKGNVSSVVFDIDNVGEAPKPIVKRVPIDGGIRVYLIAPDGADELEILSVGMTTGIESAAGEFFGLPYVDIKENDSYQILYKMKYQGTQIKPAIIDVRVSELRPDEITLSGNIVWSANKLSEATASDIVARVLFSDEVVRLETLSDFDPADVTFLKAGKQLTVTYKNNSQPITLRCYAENGSYVTVELDAVTNIDRDAPVISCEQIEVANDGKSATLTIKVNERATFKEGGGFVGELIDGEYYYTRVVTANGDYTYTFTNMSGISASITVTVDQLVLEPLTLTFSTSADGTNAVDDPAKLELKVGDTVFIKPSRKATIQISNGIEIEAESNVFTSIVIPDALGGVSPYIIATDTYGNVFVGQFDSIVPLDTSPPELVIIKDVLTVRQGTDRATLETELISNAVAFDDSGEKATITVELPESIDLIGTYSIRYCATDLSGNSSELYGRLQVTSIYAPIISVGDIKINRNDGIYLDANEEITVSVDSAGVKFDLYLAAGRKTAAQLKGYDPIADDSLSGDIVLGKLTPGIYTVLVVTAEREYFSFYISVSAEEPGQ